MKIPHPIPYQGSKRNLARYILNFFPDTVNALFEPFAGSAAVSLAAAARGKAISFYLNDINKPLMVLWNDIINSPQDIANRYEKLWHQQAGRERQFYDYVRIEFNKTHRTDYFLYLLARCVKASIRYNAFGEFNQSPDNRRKGRSPANMKEDILAASMLLRGRTELTTQDYKEVFVLPTTSDLVYMDPPYQGVMTNRDPRYFGGVIFQEFAEQLSELVERNISFILSYDGRSGEKTYGKTLPVELGLHHIELKAGRSTQATLLGKSQVTYESLYFSPALIRRLDTHVNKLEIFENQQFELFAEPIIGEES